MTDGTGRLGFARSHPKSRAIWLVINALAGLAATGTALALPAVLGVALDTIISGAALGTTLLVAAALVALSVAADLLGAYSAAAYGAAATAAVRHRLIEHLVGAVPFHHFSAGDLASRLSGQAAEAARAALTRLGFVLSLLPPAGAFVLLIVLDPRLAVAFVAGTIAVAGVLRSLHRGTSAAASGYQRAQGTIAARLTEALEGARTIAAAGTREREALRILRPLKDLRAHGERMWRVLARSTAQAAVAGPLVLVAVLAVGGLLLMSGRLSAGELFSAARYAAIGAGLGSLTGVLGGLARASAAARRVSEVSSLARIEYGASPMPHGDGTLVFQGVSHSILDGVDLTVPGGAAVAVVGRSGSGKSVLAALAARLVDPDAGRVLLDGVPLPELRRDALRAAIRIAFDRPRLIGATISDAIAPGTWRAAVAVKAQDFILRLPAGYFTPMREAPMSGGEAQRLGLTRAWEACRVLVLDDATSSLDTITEGQIPLFHQGSRTRLIITHRIGLAEQADLVVWLDSGRIRATGPHSLLWTDADYRAVFQ